MPVQEVQIGSVVFQLSLRTWGTRDANSRSACLSVSRSAGETNGESKRKTKAATILIIDILNSLTSKFIAHSPDNFEVGSVESPES